MREHPITRSVPICSPGFPRDPVLKSRGEGRGAEQCERLNRKVQLSPCGPHFVLLTTVPSGKKERTIKSLPGIPLSASNN